MLLLSILFKAVAFVCALAKRTKNTFPAKHDYPRENALKSNFNKIRRFSHLYPRNIDIINIFLTKWNPYSTLLQKLRHYTSYNSHPFLPKNVKGIPVSN